jgi:outer membrane protein, adhesin transport system
MCSVLKKFAMALLASIVVSAVQAAPVTLDEIAGKVVLTNPEVEAKWHEFKASLEERDVTWGRNLPSLDILYGTAFQRNQTPILGTPPGSLQKYNFQTGKVRLSQNLFEGFATLNDTKRLEHASLVRYYEMLDASESAALDAAAAYIDVWRNRQLVDYAKDNYVTHRIAYEKIKERMQAGVGQGADLETAAGRLALAESNLTTAVANLHDVSARYQRIVGELPPDDMEPPSGDVLAKGLPTNRADSINLGFQKSPQLKAAFENILSAKRNVAVQKAAFYPRVDAYAEHVHDVNDGGYLGDTNQSTLGLTMTWNLFNGNQDKSKKLKAAEEVSIAKDLREKVCREVRQNLSMSFNDHLRLTEQLTYLDQHLLSTDKVRQAFHDQFNIGKRTLLDLLDTENEYFTAENDYVNAEMDLMIADAKYQAASGNLLNTLQLKNLDMTPPSPKTAPDDDMFTTCPADDVGNPELDKDALFNAGMEKDRLARGNAAAPVLTPAQIQARKQVIKAAKPVVITGANFDFDSDKLKPTADARLQPVVEFANKYPEAGMLVVGHTDSIGTDEYNQDLSDRRAASVKAWLVKKGINPNRITTKGMGESQPIASNQTREGRAQNRRVEVHYTVEE